MNQRCNLGFLPVIFFNATLSLLSCTIRTEPYNSVLFYVRYYIDCNMTVQVTGFFAPSRKATM